MHNQSERSTQNNFADQIIKRLRIDHNSETVTRQIPQSNFVQSYPQLSGLSLLGKRSSSEGMNQSGPYPGIPGGVLLPLPSINYQNIRNQLVQNSGNTGAQNTNLYSPGPLPTIINSLEGVNSQIAQYQLLNNPVNQNPNKALGEMIENNSQLNEMEPVMMDLRKQILLNRGRGSGGSFNNKELSQNNKNILQIPAQISAQLITKETNFQSVQQSNPTDLKNEIFQNLAMNLNAEGFVAQQMSQQKLLKLLLEYFIQNEIKNQPKLENYHHFNNESAAKFEEGPESNNKASTSEEADCVAPEAIISDKVMPITKCPHANRKHYAKNMCSSCYRKYGRSQYASKCPHEDRLLYSMGMCQTCYLSDYHKRRSKQSSKAGAIEEEAADQE